MNHRDSRIEREGGEKGGRRKEGRGNFIVNALGGGGDYEPRTTAYYSARLKRCHQNFNKKVEASKGPMGERVITGEMLLIGVATRRWWKYDLWGR